MRSYGGASSRADLPAEAPHDRRSPPRADSSRAAPHRPRDSRPIPEQPIPALQGWRPGPAPGLPRSTPRGPLASCGRSGFARRDDRVQGRTSSVPSSGNGPAPGWSLDDVARSVACPEPCLPARPDPHGSGHGLPVERTFGVLPSAELDDGEVETIAEFDPFESRPAR